MADEFDVLTMYIEEDEDISAAAAAKEEEKHKRRQHFKQMGKPPAPPLSPEEIARRKADKEMLEKLCEHDPKTGTSWYTRIWFLDSKFDIDEETQYGPMRYSDKSIREGFILNDSLNILSAKIISSDVGFPINVYGTVMIRDTLDFKCNYIFRRNRDNCQLVKSQGDSLILTGPSRGVLFLGDAFIEIDLKIREEGEGRADSNFNKVFDHITITKMKNVVERLTFNSWLSELELVFSHVKKALEGTIEIKILSGPESFPGKITACTTDLPDDNQMLLYDYGSAGVSGTVIAGSSTDRIIQLFRRVVAVSADQMLVLRIWDDDSCISPRCISSFTPQINGSKCNLVPCGLYELQVKVVWSTLTYR